MKKCAITAMATIPLLAACYPMEQAPLVYASKATVGVGVQAGTSDNPGLEMILGYKASDVALVPVAVAKHCSNSRDECTDTIYKLDIIKGGKDDVSSNGSLEIQLNGARLERSTIVGEVKALQAQRETLDKKLTKIRERDDLQAKLDRLVPSPDDDGERTSDDEAAALQLKIDASGIPKDVTASAVQAELANVEKDITSKSDIVAQYDRRIGNLEANLVNDIAGHRNDSLSVYGTFAGGGQGDAEKASITGDKVFATGIAAQNLTEYKGVIDCLNGIKKLADDIKDPTEKGSYIAGTSSMCVKK